MMSETKDFLLLPLGLLKLNHHCFTKSVFSQEETSTVGRPSQLMMKFQILKE
jgi:hypothetical protein